MHALCGSFYFRLFLDAPNESLISVIVLPEAT